MPRWASRITRFIPARAGNRLSCAMASALLSVYPHSRGEQKSCAHAMCTRRGLSPLARGTVTVRGSTLDPHRFIPARAGNSQPGDDLLIYWTVYPRSRGEQTEYLGKARETGGLSPLARGTGHGCHRLHICDRFIPARAGNSSSTLNSSISTAVYPRSRGEQNSRQREQRTRRGLSPLARGTAQLFDAK